MNNLPQDKRLKEFSRYLRNNATKEENHLWYDYLKTYELQFYRQKIIGNFIVDFYCPKAKLVIELDGSQHYKENKKVYDEKRTDFLKSLNIVVLRFTNLDINNNFPGVCKMIDVTIKKTLE